MTSPAIKVQIAELSPFDAFSTARITQVRELALLVLMLCYKNSLCVKSIFTPAAAILP